MILDGKEYLFEGIAEGCIAEIPAGAGGSGYDPVFRPEGETRSFAQMSNQEKGSISHRGRAVELLVEFLNEGILPDGLCKLGERLKQLIESLIWSIFSTWYKINNEQTHHQKRQGRTQSSQSLTLVGIKTTGEANEQSFVEEEVYKNLGGFSVVTLNTGDLSVDDKLDEVRQLDEVETGAHVYYAEGSNRPLIATGEIFITFQSGVSEAEQAIVLEEYHLELTERRGPDRIAVRVTPQSPNPLKVAAALQHISMVKMAEPDLDTVLDEYAYSPRHQSVGTAVAFEQCGVAARHQLPHSEGRRRQ